MEVKQESGSLPAGFAAHCPHCRCQSTFIPARLSHQRHLCVTILTFGLWSIVWLALLLGKSLRPWRCNTCGWHKPEFRAAPPIPPAHPPEKVQPPTVD